MQTWQDGMRLRSASAVACPFRAVRSRTLRRSRRSISTCLCLAFTVRSALSVEASRVWIDIVTEALACPGPLAAAKNEESTPRLCGRPLS